MQTTLLSEAFLFMQQMALRVNRVSDKTVMYKDNGIMYLFNAHIGMYKYLIAASIQKLPVQRRIPVHL